jgi:hypothetical protein
MTTFAGVWGTFKNTIGMTRLTGGIGMQSTQGESRLIVIEVNAGSLTLCRHNRQRKKHYH